MDGDREPATNCEIDPSRFETAHQGAKLLCQIQHDVSNLVISPVQAPIESR